MDLEEVIALVDDITAHKASKDIIGTFYHLH
jgi:hypothetical protein